VVEQRDEEEQPDREQEPAVVGCGRDRIQEARQLLGANHAVDSDRERHGSQQRERRRDEVDERRRREVRPVRARLADQAEEEREVAVLLRQRE